MFSLSKNLDRSRTALDHLGRELLTRCIGDPMTLLYLYCILSKVFLIMTNPLMLCIWVIEFISDLSYLLNS